MEPLSVGKTPTGKISKKKKTKNQPVFATRAYLKALHKVDVMEIFGISETVALEILAETGTDLSKFPAPENFVSWLNFAQTGKYPEVS